MNAKQLLFREEARERIRRGFDALATCRPAWISGPELRRDHP